MSKHATNNQKSAVAEFFHSMYESIRNKCLRHKNRNTFRPTSAVPEGFELVQAQMERNAFAAANKTCVAKKDSQQSSHQQPAYHEKPEPEDTYTFYRRQAKRYKESVPTPPIPRSAYSWGYAAHEEDSRGPSKDFDEAALQNVACISLSPVSSVRVQNGDASGKPEMRALPEELSPARDPHHHLRQFQATSGIRADFAQQSSSLQRNQTEKARPRRNTVEDLPLGRHKSSEWPRQLARTHILGHEDHGYPRRRLQRSQSTYHNPQWRYSALHPYSPPLNPPPDLYSYYNPFYAANFYVSNQAIHYGLYNASYSSWQAEANRRASLTHADRTHRRNAISSINHTPGTHYADKDNSSDEAHNTNRLNRMSYEKRPRHNRTTGNRFSPAPDSSESTSITTGSTTLADSSTLPSSFGTMSRQRSRRRPSGSILVYQSERRSPTAMQRHVSFSEPQSMGTRKELRRRSAVADLKVTDREQLRERLYGVHESGEGSGRFE